MEARQQEDRIQYTEIVDVSPEVAFDVFVNRFVEWWPSVYTFSGDSLTYIGIEAGEGGRCIERDDAGNELVWGEVLTFQPPDRIVFSWWIQPDRAIDDDPDRASEIDVRFIDERSLTRVEFEHRNLFRHGAGASEMRQALASRQGWPMLLQLYSDLVNRPG